MATCEPTSRTLETRCLSPGSVSGSRYNTEPVVRTTANVSAPSESGNGDEPTTLTDANEVTRRAHPRPSQTRLVTVEPVLFLFMLAGSTYYPTFQSMIYYKVCLSKYSSELCLDMDNSSYVDEEDMIQGETSIWMLYEHLCFEIPSLCLSFFYGPLSDNVSRKYTMMLPLVGQVFSMLTYVVSALYMTHSAGYALIGRVISGLFGGWIGCSLAAFSYLSAVTDDRNRTTRIAIAEGCSLVGKSLGFFFSGMLLQNRNYVLVFSVACVCNFVGVVYIALWIKEPSRSTSSTVQSVNMDVMMTKVQESFSCMFRKRKDRDRTFILIVLLSIFMATFSYQAMYTLGFLYVKHHPLYWTQNMWGLFNGTRSVLSGVCLIVGVPVMKRLLHMRDTTIVLWAFVTSAISEILFGLSTHTWMVFIVGALSFMADVKFNCMRSILSKLVEPAEYGKLFAAVGSLQSLSGMLGTAMYNGIYPDTLHLWPGLCFTIGAVSTLIPIALVIWLHREIKNAPSRFRPLEDEHI